MITLSKSGNTVTFTFDENSGYLQNGTIDVPVNSLSLILDESNMATFRKSASNDIFVSANVGDFGMSKSELEAWYKANMVGSTGGGGGGVTSGEVQTMIDNSISSGITSGDTKAVAGGAVYDQVTIGGGMEVISSVTVSSSYSPVVMPDCDKFTISAGTAVGDALTSGGKVINVYDKSTDTFVFSSSSVSNMSSNYVTVEGTTDDTSIALTAVDGYYFKGDNSMYFKSNYSGGWVVTFYKNSDVEWLKDVVSANTVAIEGKQDTLSAGTGISISGNVISATGGGSTYTAGRGINIDSANTISLGVAISAGTGTNSVKHGITVESVGNYSHAEGEGSTSNGSYSHAEGYNTFAGGSYSHSEGKESHSNGNYSHAEGSDTYAKGQYSHAEGYYTTASGTGSHAEGYYTEAKNAYEHASGKYNVSRTGNTDADRTIFTVGNGTGAGENASNAFEIRQNDDIYIIKNNSYIKLQDNLGVTPSSAITSGDTNAVAGGAVYSKFDEVEQVTARALIDVNDKFDGLRLKKLTQAQYDALSGSTDSNTLYIIVN